MSLSIAQTTSVSTPQKQSAATPVTDSPGTWRHPRMQEIIRRQEAATFTDKNLRRIAVNVAVLSIVILIHGLLARVLPNKKSFPYLVWYYSRYVYWAILAVPIFNIGTSLLPLARHKDDFSDIPLTPSQRKLLGLPPSSAPPTPGSVYNTPPRFSRTPSISGSAGSKRSFSSSPRSPFSNQGSPVASSGSANPGVLGLPSSPLLQKAMNGARRSSLGSLGSPSPLGASTGASFYGGVPDSPSPTPAAAKRSTVGLNNKWLYERGRDRRSSSGNAWLHT
ncbi:NPCC-domain-containing protein [Hypoxylon rubiginosum]|uniref:NPCC-domain-containing protein n=1 Tax=Hypoxylon rubiginosum TaxID=110542 RepID=A0ACB9Z073_9PEZI|nr:NPCC-domain-containing protein [Hypoxylon rubiginosum]